MTRMVRVFVNGKGVDVAGGSTALDAVRAFSDDAAQQVERGTSVITDSRGLPASAEQRLEAGSILRLVPSRARGAAAASELPGDDA
jgi:hypothetical protein